MEENQNQQQQYDEEEQEDNELIKGERIEGSADLVRYVSEPSKFVASKYHKYLSKELAIGQIKDSTDIERITGTFKLITLFSFLGLDEIADVYHAELQAKINSMRALDGFERRMQTTITSNINKNVTGLQPEKKGILG